MPYDRALSERERGIRRQGYNVQGRDRSGITDPNRAQELDGRPRPDMQPQAGPTFSQMQQQGYARPPMPSLQATGSPIERTASQGGFGNGAPPPPMAEEGPGQGRPSIQDFLYNGVFGFQNFNPGIYQAPTVNAQPFMGRGYHGDIYNPGQDRVDANRFMTSTSNIPGYSQGGVSYDPGRVGSATESQVHSALLNPSRYDSNMAMDTFGRLRQSIDESFGVNKQLIGEEMARRGLDASTIHGGRLGDLTIQHDRNLANLAQAIAEKQAETYQTDRASAISQGMGYTGQEFQRLLDSFGSSLAGHQEGRMTQGQNFGQALSAADFSRTGQAQRFGQGIQRQAFNNDTRTNNLNSLLASLGFNQGAQGQQFNQAMGVNQQNFNNLQTQIQNLLGFGQQQFQNDMDTNQFNWMQQNNELGNWMQLLQMLGGA